MSDLSPNICFDALSVLNSNVQLVEKGKPGDQGEPEFATVGFSEVDQGALGKVQYLW